MNKSQKLSLFLLRVAMGGFMLYAGVTKLMNPAWSAAGYLQAAKTFAPFYNLFLAPNVLPVVNFINEWGEVLLGLSLIFGLGVRLSSSLGAVQMMLFYFPVLQFPYVLPHSLFIDEHIIYTLVLVLLAAIRAGRVWGLDSKLPALSKRQKSYNWFG